MHLAAGQHTRTRCDARQAVPGQTGVELTGDPYCKLQWPQQAQMVHKQAQRSAISTRKSTKEFGGEKVAQLADGRVEVIKAVRGRNKSGG